MQLDQLLASRADLWRGHDSPRAAPTGLPSGFQALDAALAGGGWPGAGLSEVLTQHQGAGLALLLPLLARLSAGPRWLLWVDPPHVPFAPALAAHGLDLTRILLVRAGTDAAWAAEQGLRSGTCAAVLAWTGPVAGAGATRQTVRQAVLQSACWTPSALRRLQLAAADTGTPMLLLRPLAAAGETSPAALRLKVSAHADGLDVGLLKQRGGRPGQRLRLLPPLIESSTERPPESTVFRAAQSSATAAVSSPRQASTVLWQAPGPDLGPEMSPDTSQQSGLEPAPELEPDRGAEPQQPSAPLTTPCAAPLGPRDQAVVGSDTAPLGSARHVRRRRATPTR